MRSATYTVLASLLSTALAAPLLTPRAGTVIPGKYIVKLKNDAADDMVEWALNKLSKTPDHVYGMNHFKGFSGDIDDIMVEFLQGLDEVDYIERDVTFTAYATTSQANAPWGIARLSTKAKGSTTYTFDDSAGEGTCAYVIDTGIDVAHPEFEGRATFLTNTIDKTNTDANGHGTHVAGTIGSKSFGVAKKTQLIAVKVLDARGSGTSSSVLAGINAAAADAKTRNCPKGTVANMSLGSPKSAAVNSAVANAITGGLFFAVAAGNDNANAAGFSPASEATACTVGATDKNDRRSSFSNFGAAVDVFAPGTQILSTWLQNTTNTISGTSMASPHIAGLAAYLSALEGKKTPAAMCARIVALSQRGIITDVPSGTANNLANNGIAGGNATAPAPGTGGGAGNQTTPGSGSQTGTGRGRTGGRTVTRPRTGGAATGSGRTTIPVLIIPAKV